MQHLQSVKLGERQVGYPAPHALRPFIGWTNKQQDTEGGFIEGIETN